MMKIFTFFFSLVIFFSMVIFTNSIYGQEVRGYPGGGARISAGQSSTTDQQQTTSQPGTTPPATKLGTGEPAQLPEVQLLKELSTFDYNQRAAFASAVRQRLNTIVQKDASLRFSEKQRSIEAQLNSVNDVQSNEWENYRNDIIENLEVLKSGIE